MNIIVVPQSRSVPQKSEESYMIIQSFYSSQKSLVWMAIVIVMCEWNSHIISI